MSQNTARSPGQKPINLFNIGKDFLDYCVKQGWLNREGKGQNVKYYVTLSGEEEIIKIGVKM
jgi:hypothetical protein